MTQSPGNASKWGGAARSLMAVFILAGLLAIGLFVTESGWGRDTTPAGIPKSGEKELRTDLEPLITRLPQLSDAVSAEWMGGTLGGTLAVGPSTYWLDAVVVLDEATLAEVLAMPDLIASVAPKVVRRLKGSLPSGEFLRSDALDEFFRESQWNADAWVAPDSGQVVLLIEGGYN